MTSSAQSRLLAFIHHESTAGLVLAAAAVIAIVFYNIAPLRPLYDAVLAADATVGIGGLVLSKPLHLWINDGLMAIFFFLVGLEIKREILDGNLSSRDQIVLPAIAALGGMIAPALIYAAVNQHHPELLRGWAIPAATDIAFALGALSILGSRVPVSLKVFLLTLATPDDLGAIVIIALFYTENLSLLSLGLAGASIAVLALLNRLHVDRTAIYICIGLAMWVLVLKSGIHATLAGVVLAFTIPMSRRDGTAMLHAIEESLHSYVKFLILPLFAFANAGIPLDGFTFAKLGEPLPLGIAAGLTMGKPIGIVVVIAAAIKLGVARLPQSCNWIHIIGAGCLAGIGFTMSLFIGGLAFTSPDLQTAVRAGVVTGSILSTLLGVAILSFAVRRAP